MVFIIPNLCENMCVCECVFSVATVCNSAGWRGAEWVMRPRRPAGVQSS